MHILITGGSGYIGSVLVRKLYESTLPISKITVYDNLMYKQVSVSQFCYRNDFEFVKGDVNDYAQFERYVKSADVIIPLAAFVGFPSCDANKEGATKTNFDQIKRIVSMLKSNQKLIYPNTDSAYGITEGICTEETPLNPTSHYGIVKTQAEHVVLNGAYGVVLRLATVFGVSPRMRLDLLVNDFTYKAMTDGYIILFEKTFKRNVVHVQDVAKAFVFTIENYDKMNNQVFNVGMSDTNITKLELCERIKKYIPKFIWSVAEFSNDPDKRNYAVSSAKLEGLGWKCDFSLDNGIQELIKAYSIIIHSNRNYTNL